MKNAAGGRMVYPSISQGARLFLLMRKCLLFYSENARVHPGRSELLLRKMQHSRSLLRRVYSVSTGFLPVFIQVRIVHFVTNKVHYLAKVMRFSHSLFCKSFAPVR